jgi:hypothetical protein
MLRSSDTWDGVKFVIAFGAFMVGLWPYSAILVGIAASGIGLFYVWRYRRAVARAFRKNEQGEPTQAARLWLAAILTPVSLGTFVWAVVDEGSAVLCFVAGLVGVTGLRLAGLALDAATLKKRFWRALIDNFQEVLVVLTGVAAVYSAASIYLSYRLQGSATLRELRAYDGAVLYARVFLDTLKFSTIQTVTLVALLIALRWLERRWTGNRGTAAETAWKALHAGTKWMSRAAMVALFAASFTFLAVRSEGPASKVTPRIRDFEQAYAQLQGDVEKTIDAELKRELISQTWAKMDPAIQRELQQSIENRVAAEELGKNYEALQKFGFHDARIERVVAKNSLKALKIEPDEEETHTEKAATGPPDRYLDVSINTMQAAAGEARKAAEKAENEPAPKPFEEMETSLKTGLMDLAFDHAKEHVKLFEALDSSFPGIGKMLDGIWDALTESFVKKRKEARDRTIQDRLTSHHAKIGQIAEEQARLLAAGAGLGIAAGNNSAVEGKAALVKRLQESEADAAAIQSAEETVRQKARIFEATELVASKARLERFAKRLQQEGEGKSLLSLDGDEYLSSGTGAKLEALGRLEAFGNKDTVRELRDVLGREQAYQQEISSARVGRSGWGGDVDGAEWLNGIGERPPIDPLEEAMRERVRGSRTGEQPFRPEPIRPRPVEIPRVP